MEQGLFGPLGTPYRNTPRHPSERLLSARGYNDILAWSKIEAGRHGARYRPMSTSRHRRRRHKVVVRPPPSGTSPLSRQGPKAHRGSRPRALKQSVPQSLSNAVSSPATAQLDVASVANPQRSCTIAIKDTGIGIQRPTSGSRRPSSRSRTNSPKSPSGKRARPRHLPRPWSSCMAAACKSRAAKVRAHRHLHLADQARPTRTNPSGNA